MQTKLLVCAIITSAVFFTSGVAVGQRVSSSKFSKYFRPADFAAVDLISLQVNVDNIRGRIPLSDDISIPEVFFNYKEDRPQASVFILSDFEKASLDTVKARIAERYYSTFYKLQSYIPELSQDEFVLRVLRITTDADHKLFAECKHGNIVFH